MSPSDVAGNHHDPRRRRCLPVQERTEQAAGDTYDAMTARSHQADPSRFFPIPIPLYPSPHTQSTDSLGVGHSHRPRRPQPTSPPGDRMAERERKRKRAAEEWERRKRGRKREKERQVGWASDPVEALGEDVMGRVMEFLDARSVARCTAVSCAWRGVAADNRLWAPMVRAFFHCPLALLYISRSLACVRRLCSCSSSTICSAVTRIGSLTIPSSNRSSTLVLKFAGIGMRLTALLDWGENP